MDIYPVAKISNHQLAGMAGYRVLATIPEDPLYYTDAMCYAFDKATADVAWFFENAPDTFILVETYEAYPDILGMPSDEPVEGVRQLVVFPRAKWERYGVTNEQ